MTHDEDMRHGLDDLEASVPQVIEEAIRICEVPAPPFQEGRRAEYVQRRMAELGLGRPGTDAEGNVVTELPGQPGNHTVIDVGVLPKGLRQTFLVAASLLRKG